MDQVAHPIHLNFDGDGDLLLNFFRRASRPLGDDPGILVGDIGIRLHRQFVEREDAPGQQQYPHRQHHHPVAKREIDEVSNHALLLLGGAGELESAGHHLVVWL